MMRCIVVDDEPLARLRLKGQLEQMHCEVVAEAENGVQALEKIAEFQPDVVLLDIQMPELSGLEVAAHLARQAQPPLVVFSTAFDEHALEAFRVNAIDYLLKPIKQEALQATFEKIKKLSQSTQALATVADKRRHLAIKHHAGMKLVPVESITLLLAEHKYVNVYYGEEQPLLSDETLKQLELEFADVFIRVHRNALVGIQFIEGLEKAEDGSYQVKIRDFPEKVAVSRRQLSEIRTLLKRL